MLSIKKYSTLTGMQKQQKKGGYEHFMLKEIHDQPKAVRDTFGTHISKMVKQ